VKRSCTADKKAWLNQKGTEAEEAAHRNDHKTLFRVVRDLVGTKSSSSVPVKDKNGKTLLTVQEQNAHWVEHNETYEQLFSNRTGENVPEEWRQGIIVKLPKKGDISNCNNWRDNNIAVCSSQGLLHHTASPSSWFSRGNIAWWRWWRGRLSTTAIMCRTDLHPTEHHWTVCRIPATTVNKLCRL